MMDKVLNLCNIHISLIDNYIARFDTVKHDIFEYFCKNNSRICDIIYVYILCIIDMQQDVALLNLKAMSPNQVSFDIEYGTEFLQLHFIDKMLVDRIYNFVLMEKKQNKIFSEHNLIASITNLVNISNRWSIPPPPAHCNYCYSFNRSLLYVNDNLSNSLTLKEVSRVAGFSEFYYHRLFKKNFNVTLASYIRKLKLEKAAFDIMMTSQTLDDIADGIGFADRSSLTKSFKKEFGYNPSLLRQRVIEEIEGFEPKIQLRIHPEIRKVQPYTLLYSRIFDVFNTESFFKSWKSIVDFARLDGIHYKSSIICDTSKDNNNKSRDHPGALCVIFPFEQNSQAAGRIYAYLYNKWIYEVQCDAQLRYPTFKKTLLIVILKYVSP